VTALTEVFANEAEAAAFPLGNNIAFSIINSFLFVWCIIFFSDHPGLSGLPRAG